MVMQQSGSAAWDMESMPFLWPSPVPALTPWMVRRSTAPSFFCGALISCQMTERQSGLTSTCAATLEPLVQTLSTLPLLSRPRWSESASLAGTASMADLLPASLPMRAALAVMSALLARFSSALSESSAELPAFWISSESG